MAEDKSKDGASQLKQLREQAGFTQEELARRCGIPLRSYQRWESGESAARPNIPQVKALCRELNISIEQLPDQFGPSDPAST